MSKCVHFIRVSDVARVAEASAGWTRHEYAIVVRLVRQMILAIADDLMAGELCNGHCVEWLDGSSITGWTATRQNFTILTITSVQFDDGDGDFDPDGGLDILAYDGTASRAEFMLRGDGRTWSLDQIGGAPIFDADDNDAFNSFNDKPRHTESNSEPMARGHATSNPRSFAKTLALNEIEFSTLEQLFLSSSINETRFANDTDVLLCHSHYSMQPEKNMSSEATGKTMYQIQTTYSPSSVQLSHPASLSSLLRTEVGWVSELIPAQAETWQTVPDKNRCNSDVGGPCVDHSSGIKWDVGPVHDDLTGGLAVDCDAIENGTPNIIPVAMCFPHVGADDCNQNGDPAVQ